METIDANKTIMAARAYLARGLAVMPLNGKIPLTEHGVKDATTEPDLVNLWFKQPRNIGIAVPEGVVVVDIDPRNGGMESWREWLDSYDPTAFDGIPCAKTGGGGYHFWFRLPTGVTKLKKNPAVGIDLLTAGRYAVAPPSFTDEMYRWETALPQDLAELSELPGYIAALARLETRAADSWERPSGGGSRTASGGDEISEAAHRRTSWDSLLGSHGWVRVGESRWRHPGSDNQYSATIKHDCLFVYSPNTPFPKRSLVTRMASRCTGLWRHWTTAGTGRRVLPH